ncbi:MAG: methionine adenosyltransferase [Candidatus Cryptobacteroides sp.]|nr:methionine adenosyltransferase [Candidatus Cryptobacteroides sp.]CCX52437.1 s-adenosylmethionine synthase [Alistipes sp. CAG:514]
MNYLFTSESVSEGHPDKVADQISDAVLDEFLRQDPEAKVACETFCSTGLVVIGGEVRSEDAYVDIQKVVRGVINRIGYNKADYMFDGNSCGVLSEIHEQSQDINRGVERENPEDQGAGDQGMMFGYACRDTEDYMPLPLYLSQIALQELADIRHNSPELMPYLRPDSKSQFTVEYDESHRPVRVHTIVISTQHDDFVADGLGNIPYSDAVQQFGQDKVDQAMHDRIEADVRNILLPRLKAALNPQTAALFKDDFILHVNPTGKFVIGGPAGDTGLTGRKIIVDTYGGKGAHGGGAFSGKDPSKVDRSAAYAARHIAKNMVAAGVAQEMLVQIAYAIGVARPVSVFVDTYGTGIVPDAEIARRIENLFDLRPAAIIRKFELKNPIYEPTAAYGHFGRKPYTKSVKVGKPGCQTDKLVQFFAWEKLDAVEEIKKAFGI